MATSKVNPRPTLRDDTEGDVFLDEFYEARAKRRELKDELRKAKLELERLEKVEANNCPLNAEAQSYYETLSRSIRLNDTALVSQHAQCRRSCQLRCTQADFDKHTTAARENLKRQVEAFDASTVPLPDVPYVDTEDDALKQFNNFSVKFGKGAAVLFANKLQRDLSKREPPTAMGHKHIVSSPVYKAYCKPPTKVNAQEKVEENTEENTTKPRPMRSSMRIRYLL
jgi:hypothetical protein